MLRSKYALPTPALLLHESYIATHAGMQGTGNAHFNEKLILYHRPKNVENC